MLFKLFKSWAVKTKDSILTHLFNSTFNVMSYHIMACHEMGCHATVYVDVLSFCITIAIAVTVTTTVSLDCYVSTASLNVLYSILIMLFDNSDYLHRIE